jgi:hypothetical protein
MGRNYASSVGFDGPVKPGLLEPAQARAKHFQLTQFSLANRLNLLELLANAFVALSLNVP